MLHTMSQNLRFLIFIMQCFTIKPVSLWKIDIFDYDVVFNRNNIVYFVKRNMIDYFDFALDISVKGVEFRDFFFERSMQNLTSG